MAASQAAQAGSTPVSRSITQGLSHEETAPVCVSKPSFRPAVRIIKFPSKRSGRLRRGRCPHRPASRNRVPIPAKVRWFHRRRGALYMRPCRTAGSNRPSIIAAWAWRHVGMPPYGVRRGCGGKRNPARAAIKAAPTPHFRPGPFGGVPTPRPTAPPGSPGMLRKSQACPGGYIIRPYGPAHGLVVGAGFMPARNRGPIPAGVRWFRPPAPPDKAK